MEDFYTYDPLSAGSKGLVFISDKILVYRRDGKTQQHPNELDLPGGGPEPGETPFETFRREVREEFGLAISRKDIIYVRKYPKILEKGKFVYFPVAVLSAESHKDIQFGDEGSEYLLMPAEEYTRRNDAWPVLQERTKDYIAFVSR